MKRLLVLICCAFFVVIGMGGKSFAVPYTWTDTTDFNPDRYIGWWQNFSYSHDLTDNTPDPFKVGEDHIDSYSLSVSLYDDGGKCDFWELAYVNQPGILGDGLYIDFEADNQTFGWSLAGVISLNATGELGVTITSWLGDFYLDSSTLIATGDNATASAPVPEPATMLLFGFGLIGMAAFGRKKYLTR